MHPMHAYCRYTTLRKFTLGYRHVQLNTIPRKVHYISIYEMTTNQRRLRARIVARELGKLFPAPLRTPLHYANDWQLVVAVILSAQCTDERVNEVTKKLFKKYKSLNDYAGANPHQFEAIIRPTGFFRNKTRLIIQCAEVIRDRHNGKIPQSMEKLLTLPGFGRKTANVILSHVHGITEGIAVDTHVRRLSHKFRLSRETNPNKIERDLCKLLPQDEWLDFSYRLKAYGHAYSPARKFSDTSDPISKILLQKRLMRPS